MENQQAADIQQVYQRLRRQLIRIHRQETLVFFLEKLFYYLGITVIAFAVFIALDTVFLFPPVIRGVFVSVASIWVLGILSIYTWQFLNRSLTIRTDYLRDVAIDVGQRFPEVGDTLVNFLDLYHQSVPPEQEHFRLASLRQLQKKLMAQNLSDYAPIRRGLHTLRQAAVFAVVILVLFFSFPGAVKIGLMRVLYPTEDIHRPLPFRITNVSGNLNVLKNEPVTLSCKIDGLLPDELKLVIQSKGDTSGTIRQDVIPIVLNGKNTYSHTVPRVQSDFQYWFEGELKSIQYKGRVGRSDVANVTVISRPVVREIRVKYDPPPYTGEEPRWLDPNEGSVTVLKGSVIHLSVLADRVLQTAWVMFQDSTRIPLQTRGREAQGSWQVKRSVEYQIFVQDNNGATNFEPITYPLIALDDAAPQVEIVVPGADVDLGEELSIPLKIEATDDYGFSRLLLKGRIIRAGSTGDTTAFQQALPMQPVGKGRIVSTVEWNVADLYLIPDDFVEYYAEVWDNNTVTGPSRGRSRVFVLRLPSLIDLMEETTANLEETREDVKSTVETTRELKKKLEEINRELKRDKKLTWERRKEIEQQLAQQKEVQQKLEEIQKQLEETIQQLDKNAMLSPEVLEKYFELQNMLQNLITPEMQKIMQELQQALQKMDGRKIQQAMQRLQASVEEFERQIERAYELFKQVEMERQLDELTKLAEKLNEQQQTITKKLNEAVQNHQAPPRELSNQQLNTEREFQFLEQKLEKAEKFFEENRATTAQKLKQVQQFSQQQNIQQHMQEARQHMQQQNSTQALTRSQQAESDLKAMQQMLKETQQEMVQAQKEKLMRAMQKTTRDLLEASFTQEAIMNETRRLSFSSPLMTRVARKEANLRENLNAVTQQIVELSHQTFFISPQMNRILQQIYNNMERALKQMEERNPHSASSYQQKAMAAMNQAILSMQSAMKQLAQSGSASGFEEFMKQLQQMAQAQGQVNEQSMSLFQQMQQGKLQLSEDALARLAAQQEMIRRSLQQLQQEQGYRRDVTGRLDGIAQQMDEVVKELKRKRLDRKVIERQQKILSRLLEAQKSIRERDQSRKRKAEWEKAPIVRSPGPLDWQSIQREDQLRKEMLRSLEEGYSLEYQKFIKQYYDALFEANTSKQVP